MTLPARAVAIRSPKDVAVGGGDELRGRLRGGVGVLAAERVALAEAPAAVGVRVALVAW